MARRAPQKAAFAGRGGRPSARSVEAEGPAGARRPPPTSEPGWSPPPQAGRTRISPRSAPATSRLHPQHRRATTGPRAARPLPPRQIAGGFLCAGFFPVFLSTHSFAFFFSIKVAAVGSRATDPEELSGR